MANVCGGYNNGLGNSGLATTCIAGTQGCLCDSRGTCSPGLTCTPQTAPKPNLCCNGTDCSGSTTSIGATCSGTGNTTATCTPGITISTATATTDSCGYPTMPDGCGGLTAECRPCCVPPTCANYPANTCGQQDDGCGGKTPNCGTPKTCADFPATVCGQRDETVAAERLPSAGRAAFQRPARINALQFLEL